MAFDLDESQDSKVVKSFSGEERAGCVEKIKHNVDTCKSTGNSLQVFYSHETGKYTGYCFACAAKGLPAYVDNPYRDGKPKDPPKKKTAEEIREEIAEIRGLKFPDFEYRGIPISYFKKGHVKLAYSEFDGKTPFTFNFPLTKNSRLKGYKCVMLDKKVMWSIGDVKDCDLYNWFVAKKKKAKRLYITEGQWDCHALEYLLEKYVGNKYPHAVTSIPNGCKSAAPTIARMKDQIKEHFDEVVLVFDNDEEGRNAVKEVQKVFPEVLEAPHVAGIKDANEALKEGCGDKFAEMCRWKARRPLREGVVTVSQVVSNKVSAPEVGLSFPWPTVTDYFYGQRDAETLAVAGGVGAGKTVIAHSITAHNTSIHSSPVFAAFLEEDNLKQHLSRPAVLLCNWI